MQRGRQIAGKINNLFIYLFFNLQTMGYRLENKI